MLNQLKVTVSYRHPRRRGVPRGVHRRRGGGYHRVGGPGRGRGVGDPPLRSPPSGSGWGEGGSRPFSSFSVQNIQNTPHGAHLLWCPLRGFFGQNHRSPLKRHSTSREGSSSLRCGRLAARLDDAFLLISVQPAWISDFTKKSATRALLFDLTWRYHRFSPSTRSDSKRR